MDDNEIRDEIDNILQPTPLSELPLIITVE